MTKRKQTPDVLAEILGGEPVGNSDIGDLPANRRISSSTVEAKQVVWEYHIVTFQDYKGWRPRYQDGRELRDWTNGPLLQEFVSIMGEAGWELAAASAGERLFGNADNHHLYFKRPKQG